MDFVELTVFGCDFRLSTNPSDSLAALTRLPIVELNRIHAGMNGTHLKTTKKYIFELEDI